MYILLNYNGVCGKIFIKQMKVENLLHEKAEITDEHCYYTDCCKVKL